ncbi:Hypothetical protein FKW44_017516, partial [Caligus rogercresseyi]
HQSGGRSNIGSIWGDANPPDWLEAYEIEHLVSTVKGSSMHQERTELDSLWVSITSSEDI